MSDIVYRQYKILRRAFLRGGHISVIQDQQMALNLNILKIASAALTARKSIRASCANF
ncbi:MAG: hypothetical protein AAF412_06675 [Pseudomonadota bacterium]